jgi:DNA-binding NarL/FixJ family response regulator
MDTQVVEQKKVMDTQVVEQKKVMDTQVVGQKKVMDTQVVEQKKAQISVMVIDDHVILRQGIREMLNKENDLEVVAEAGDEKAALSLNIKLKPDIVLVNIALDHVSGMNIAKQLMRSSPGTRVVLFAGSNDEKLLFEAVRIGVHGYLQKTLSIDDLGRALRAVHCGERILGETQAVTQMVIEFHRLAKEQNRLNWGLSSTEVECIQFASQGWTNKEIGKQLFWSEVQVKRKMQDIYRKLQVTDRAQAVAEAMRHGLI